MAPEDLLGYVSRLGVGGMLALIMYLLSRRDAKENAATWRQQAERWEHQREELMALVKENSRAQRDELLAIVTANTAAITALDAHLTERLARPRLLE